MININNIDINEKKWKIFFEELTEEEAEHLEYDVDFLGRPKQLQAIYSTTQTTIMLSGRGFGKSWTLAQMARIWKDKYKELNYCLPSYGEVEKILVPTFEEVFPPWDKPIFKLHRGFVEFKNGSKCYITTSESYERIRGINSACCLVDELASFQYAEETYQQLILSNRLGDSKFAVATTPRPSQFLRKLLTQDNATIITGSSNENRLIDTSLMYKMFEDTRFGRQELHGELLLDVPGALWSFEMIDPYRKDINIDQLTRIVISIDPAVTATKSSDETGIIVAGIDVKNECYILEDLSGIYKPPEWARIVINAFDRYKADKIVVEKNNGGDLLTHTINSVCTQLNRPNIPITTVWASRGKMTRAEPIVTFYEKGLVHHTKTFVQLETQLTTWNYSEGQASPDRLDSLVWNLTELFRIGKNNNDWVLTW